MTDFAYRDGFDADDFLALAQRVWPRDYSAAAAISALQRTINIGAWDGQQLVGSVRVLTDGYFFATIPEILVDPAYQRRGIGRRLMELALERTPRGKVFFGAQPESVAFFERIGCLRTLTGFGVARPLRAATDAATVS
jgi:ribosomal protein S18 acetylase RimI-like enzyme